MSCNTKTSLAAVIDAVNAQLNNNYVDRDDPRIDQGVFTEPTIRGGLMLDEAAKLDFCGYVTECGQREPFGKQWVDRPLYPYNTLVSYEDGGEIKSRWQDIDDVVAGTEIGESYTTYEETRNLGLQGYTIIDSFELGATITQRNQALRHEADGKLYRWAGDLPKAVPTYSTPTSSGGTGDNAWLEVSDATLRQELANPDMGSAMVGRGVVAVDSIADLLALPEEYRREDLRYLVQSYHAGWELEEPFIGPMGGGEFSYDPARAAENDGGSVIQGFVRNFGGTFVSIADFGAKQNEDSTDAIIAASDYVRSLQRSSELHYPFDVIQSLPVRLSGGLRKISGAGSGPLITYNGPDGTYCFDAGADYSGGGLPTGGMVNVAIEDLRIVGATNKVNGVDARRLRYSKFRNVRVSSVGIGWHTDNSWGSQFYSIAATTCVNGFVNISQANGVVISGGLFERNDVGITCGRVSGLFIGYGTIIEGNTIGIKVNGITRGLYINGVYFEGNTSSIELDSEAASEDPMFILSNFTVSGPFDSVIKVSRVSEGSRNIITVKDGRISSQAKIAIIDKSSELVNNNISLSWHRVMFLTDESIRTVSDLFKTEEYIDRFNYRSCDSDMPLFKANVASSYEELSDVYVYSAGRYSDPSRSATPFSLNNRPIFQLLGVVRAGDTEGYVNKDIITNLPTDVIAQGSSSSPINIKCAVRPMVYKNATTFSGVGADISVRAGGSMQIHSASDSDIQGSTIDLTGVMWHGGRRTV